MAIGSRLGRTIEAGRGPIVEINITPFVDIILVVLIIFLLTSTLAATPKTLGVALPRASAGEAPPTSRVWTVTLASDGVISVDGAALDEAALRERARQELANGTATCVLSADASAAHGAVVAVLDALRQEGVSQVAFQVRVSDGEPAPSAPP